MPAALPLPGHVKLEQAKRDMSRCAETASVDDDLPRRREGQSLVVLFFQMTTSNATRRIGVGSHGTVWRPRAFCRLTNPRQIQIANMPWLPLVADALDQPEVDPVVDPAGFENLVRRSSAERCSGELGLG
jgi:hypothetical protein